MKNIKMLTKEELKYLESVDPFLENPLLKRKSRKNDINIDVDKRLMDILLTLGISAHLQGYQYLRDSIKIIMHNPEYLNSITKKLYPIIAERHDTTASRVERGIRHALEVSFCKGKMIYLNNIFGLEVLRKDERPTNSEFVALLADKLMLESKK